MSAVGKKPTPPPKKPVVITRVQTGFCQIYATFEMQCFRCGVLVPAKTHHRCGTETP
jgi:hypothetical protein